MQYLKTFLFPDRDQEFDFFLRQKRTCYTDFYPFQVLLSSDLTELSLAPVTILHGGNGRERSNGESAFMYFTEKIWENGLYLLDEPENSLSPGRQQELARFLEDSVRFFHCQFIIATHSPFMLALKDARIYDLDECPVTVKHWTQLKNVQEYYRFFYSHHREFEQ
ncbi:MAG: AAA family ATPase [Lachnospiraceae bacterium]|nr:AAA family ATPase [Lachnospiraceae bacterium]